MKISETIKKTNLTLEARGINRNSFFTVNFNDMSSITEKETNWSDISEEREVDYFGENRIVKICKYHVKKIEIDHGDKHIEIILKEGEGAFQMMRSMTSFNSIGGKKEILIGRVIGVVKEGIVTEERVINDRSGEIFSLKIDG